MEERRMEMPRRDKMVLRIIAILGLVYGLHGLSGPVRAQEKYPTKPINFLIGYPAGGTTDVCARPLVAAAGKILGQPIVVVNKPGGASAVAVATLKTENPTGTLSESCPAGRS